MTSIADEARIALDNLADRAGNLLHPTLRIGVAGLSRAGKTVFITALVHNLLHGGRLPLFSAGASGRIARTYLEEQPDDAVPRFAYESHIRTVLDELIRALELRPGGPPTMRVARRGIVLVPHGGGPVVARWAR